MRLKAHIYNLETGEVRITITGPESLIKQNTREGESVYLSEMDTRAQVIVNGKVQIKPVVPVQPGPAIPDLSYAAFLRAIADNKEAEFMKLVKDTLSGGQRGR